jgi:hypothetical protein
MTKAEKLQIIAENEQKVYEAGKKAATDEVVFEAGRKAQYDEFWDIYQNKGTITQAQYMFARASWTDTNFKPKYSMKFANASQLFNSCRITDLKGILERQGVTFDFSNCPALNYLCYEAQRLTRFPVLSAVKATPSVGLQYSFYNCKALVSIDEIILPTNKYIEFTTTFYGCESLEEIRFSGGKIGKNISFKDCKKLSKASIINILNSQAEDAFDATVTLSLDAVNKAFETSEGANDGESSEEWYDVWFNAWRTPILI